MGSRYFCALMKYILILFVGCFHFSCCEDLGSIFDENHDIVAVKIHDNNLHQVEDIAQSHGYINMGQV